MNPRLAGLGGLALAVAAEACSVGLLGLSGWFIASSAVAGTATLSSFSYLDPSGGVRAFALGRIVTNYASRVRLHSAALRRITAARLGFYDRAAANAGSHGTWSGQSLDRVLADADTVGMALIQTIAPLVVAAALTAGSCLLIAFCGYPLVAVIVAVTAICCAGLAYLSAHRVDDGARGRLRSELVTAVEAWPEMASLGAANRLAERTLARLSRYERGPARDAARTSQAMGAARALTAIAVLVTAVLARQAPVPTLVFLVLLAAGTLVSAERLVDAAQSHRLARQAQLRLRTADRAIASPGLLATYERRHLDIRGYALPGTPTRQQRQLDFEVPTGQTVVVTGASGAGKTTLLNAIASALPWPHAVAVAADDYLFTGTVAENMRLADPTASDTDVERLLVDMGLDDIAPATPVGVGGRELSGGEQRRLHIARGLIARPDVLIVDEPTTGLDSATASCALRAIRRWLPTAVLVLAMHRSTDELDDVGAWTKISLD